MTKVEFKSLFDAHFEQIRNYVYYRSGNAESATDIAQDVFLKFWEKDFSYHPQKNLGLLYKMAGEEFVSRYRHQKVVEKYNQSVQFSLPKEAVKPDEVMEYEQLNDAYEKALAEMTEKQRTVFLLNRRDGIKQAEIADQLGVSVKAVEKLMRNALKLLRLRLNYYG